MTAILVTHLPQSSAAQQGDEGIIKPTASLSTESSTSSNSSWGAKQRVTTKRSKSNNRQHQEEEEEGPVLIPQDDAKAMHVMHAPTPPPTPATTGRWSTEEQDQFIALILPHINGRNLREEEINNIRAEAREANLPDSCVDRLLEENAKVRLEKQKQKQEKRRQKRKDRKHKRKQSREEFDTMDDVDESENILAYFSRMASLKQGGHFPDLDTSVCETFVDSTADDHHVEVDWDVGYVKKTLDTSLEATYIQDQTSSWEDNGFQDDHDDARSNGSGTIEGRSRYNRQDKEDRPMSPFDALLLGGASSPTRHVTWDTALSTDENETANPPAVEALLETETDDAVLGTSLVVSEKMEDAILRSREETPVDGVLSSFTTTAPYCYGYKLDLDEWTRKKHIAEWQPNPKSKNSVLASFSCQTQADEVVADELSGGISRKIQAPSRLQGMAAVKRMMAKTNERRQQRLEMKERRRVPEDVAYSSKVWQLPYRERCVANPGYMGVDQYSMMESTAAVPLHLLSQDSRDCTPWELREVKQHFLYDQSAVERNWFGRLRRKRGNDPNKFRPPRVRSMEMPQEGSDESSCGNVDDTTWTESRANSKTTASKSTLATNTWKSNDSSRNDANTTTSVSYSSGQGTEHDGDDEKSSRYGGGDRSLFSHDQSATTRTGNDGASTLLTDAHSVNDGNSTLFTHDLGLSAMAADATNTFSTFLGLSSLHQVNDRSMSMDADDIESTGVSEILDADDDSADGDVPSTLVGGKPTDRYVSSFSDTGTSTRSVSCTDDYHTGRSSSGCSSSRVKRDDDASSHGSSSGGGSSCSTSSSFCTSDSCSSSGYSDDGTWEDAPECGTFTNVKPKLGERVSRVTPDHTSHLLRSRFRKKHFPRGSFPYDK